MIMKKNTYILRRKITNNALVIKNVGKAHKFKESKKALSLALMLMASSNILFHSDKPNLYAQSSDKNEITDINYRNKFSGNFGAYGEFYFSHIPDIQNVALHDESLEKIRILYKDIQGCEYKNPSVLNGLTIDELNSKVLAPAQNLVDRKKIGKDQINLVLMSFDQSVDPRGAFNWNLASNGFTSLVDKIDNMNIKYEESFLGHYDNIILLQPNDISADEALDKLFNKLEVGFEKGSAVDLAFIGHGTNKIGVSLSRRLGLSLEKSMLDESDFDPIIKGGNEFAQNIKTIFQNSIDNGYSPRVIGMGCISEFMQKAMNKIMDADYINKVKVLGTPYSTNGNFAIGFNSDYIEMLVNVSEIKKKCGLLIKITDSGWKFDNNKEFDTFMIDPSKGLNMDIINNYFDNNVTEGSITKPSGVIMQYAIKKYN